MSEFVLATECPLEETHAIVYPRLYQLSTEAVLTVLDGWSTPIQVRVVKRADGIHELRARAENGQASTGE